MDNYFTVKVNDSFEYEIAESDIKKLDLIETSPSQFHVLEQNKSIDVELENSDFINKKYRVKVNSNSYEIQISNPLDKMINEMGFSVGITKKLNEIKAPMPGIILAVNIIPGQEVKEGETLLILEAMKMENAIGAPRDGVIKKVKVTVGGTVEKGAIMVELE